MIQSAPANQTVPAWPLRILLAEADAGAARLVYRALTEDGHEVLEVGDGGSLLDQVAATIVTRSEPPFDLIIAEQRLSGVTGLAVLNGLRAFDRTTPYILIADPGDLYVRAQTRNLGATLLPRPIVLEELRRVVTAVEATLQPPGPR